MKRKFIVKESVFKTGTLFLVGYSHEEMGKEIKNRGVKDFKVYNFKSSNGAQLFFTEEDGVPHNFRVVWIRNFEKTPECIGTASHEIFHLVVRICDWKGIPITAENNADETGAYLEDFYMRHFIGKLFNKKPNW